MLGPWYHRRPADRRTEAGFTLIELLVATAMSLILAAAVVAMLTSVLRSQPENAERTAQVQDSRVKLERMVRELRQGSAVAGSPGTATSLTLDAFVRSGCDGAGATTTAVLCRVSYECTASGSAATCTRRAGTAAPETVLTGLASPGIFSYATTTSPTCDSSTTGVPRFVCVKLTYPAGEGGEAVTVEDSAYLRNSGV